jgi:phenylalanyl-tRNA synthetase alpha subunit
MVLLDSQQDPTYWLHWGVTGVITAGVFLLWYFYTKAQDQRDDTITKLAEALGKSIDLTDKKVDDEITKRIDEMKQFSKEFYDEINNIKKDNNENYKEFTNALNTLGTNFTNSLNAVNLNLMKELGKIESAVASIGPKKRNS